MTLIHLFLVHRYRIDSVHYLSPSEDNQYQTAKMKTLGIFSEVNNEIGEIIVGGREPQADRGTAGPGRPGAGEADREADLSGGKLPGLSIPRSPAPLGNGPAENDKT